MKKRIFAAVLALLLAISLVFATGCSSNAVFSGYESETFELGNQ